MERGRVCLNAACRDFILGIVLVYYLIIPPKLLEEFGKSNFQQPNGNHKKSNPYIGYS